jgi:hypothetical protein
MPDAAQMLRHIPPDTIPYISAVDLIIFKINSCGLRAQIAKRQIDALDAEALLEQETALSPLSLSTGQREIVEPCIADVVTNGTKHETWWRQRLGLHINQENADDYWTWSHEHQAYYHMNDDGTFQLFANGQFTTSQ